MRKAGEIIENSVAVFDGKRDCFRPTAKPLAAKGQGEGNQRVGTCCGTVLHQWDNRRGHGMGSSFNIV